MIDSTNPRQLADNIRKLWDKFKSISGDLLPSRSTATTGQILKLTGETKTPAWEDEYSYTPPAYSTAETATGQKWIDGKDVYFITLSGNFPEITQSSTQQVGEVSTSLNIIKIESVVTPSSLISYVGSLQVVYRAISGVIQFLSVGSSFSEAYYSVIVYYTKPDPTPGRAPEDPDQEPEPEEKKTTKKKTTKKKTTKKKTTK